MRFQDIDVGKYNTLLLDRDGTINVQIASDYVRRWEDFEFIPGVRQSIARWTALGKRIYVVTNQRGIAKGFYSREDLDLIHRNMVAEIERYGGRIDGIYYCSSLTEEDIRRKPGRGMFDDILREHPQVDPSRTLMIGDSDADSGFAANCGIDFVRVDPVRRQKRQDIEVIILAGGLGTRLRTEVRDVPKCMAPVAGKPFLWYILSYLKKFNQVSRVILSVGYLREVIFEWISAHRDEFPFGFDFAVEEEPLGTGGGIRLAMEKVVGKEAVILNGDTFFDVDLNLLLRQHRAGNMLLSLALKPMEDFDRYGEVVTQGESDCILKFKEKCHCAKGKVNGGVYVLSKDSHLMDGLPRKFSFEKEVLEKNAGNPRVAGFIHDGYFIDIGIPEDYRRSQNEFARISNID